MIKVRSSFLQFLGFGLGYAVPDANTIWCFCEALKRFGTIDRLFAGFDPTSTV
jgi:hypothetical protein